MHFCNNHANHTGITGWRIDDDGMLRVTAHILKEGVYAYGAKESGLAEALPGVDPVMQYIPLSEFTEEALTTLEGKPVVISEHEWRDARNTLADGLTVGTVAGRPTVTDDGCIACDLLIFDPETIRKVTGKELVEVSAGYNATPVPGDGDFAGRAFHAAQSDLHFNHVLLLPEGMGRLGYDVRIINQMKANPAFRAEHNNNRKPEEATMPTTVTVSTGNRRRSFRFSNEQDAARAEEMLTEEQARNAQSLGKAANEIAELKMKLDEQSLLLEEARALIERLLAPEEQEARARELMDQREDEEAIINAEIEEGPDAAAKKEAFANALRDCRTLAERRVRTVSRVMNARGRSVSGRSQDYFDGAFSMLAADAGMAVRGRPGSPGRVRNGSMVPAGNGASTLSGRDRMLAPMKNRAATARTQKIDPMQ